MAQKQSILGRIGQLTRANINALLDKAEDPEKMLDQLVCDYTNSIAEAEDAVAQTIGNLRLAEADHAEDVAAVKEWGAKALAASQKADSLRTSGQAAEADKFDQLAKIALSKQIGFETEAKQAAPQIAAQNETVEKLKAGLIGMQGKLGELQTKRDQLVDRAKSAEAQAKVQDAVKSIDVLDPTSELGRFEDKVRRSEAQVAGQAELNAATADPWDELEESSTNAEVEARLSELKSLGAGTATTEPVAE
jgi:phage shock protein A